MSQSINCDFEKHLFSVFILYVVYFNLSNFFIERIINKNKKNFEDPSFELFKTSQIIRLIDTVIYSIVDGKIFKFKVSDINISTLNNDVYVNLNCSPLEEQYMHLFYTDVELNFFNHIKIYFFIVL